MRVITSAILTSLLYIGGVMPGAAAGDPDPGFGDNGQLMLVRPDSTHTSVENTGDVAALPDGRYYWTMADGIGGVLVGRIGAGGLPDATFGEDGVLTLAGCAAPRPVRLAPAADGGLVIWTGACLFRLAVDGEIEPAFAAGAVLPSSDFRAADLVRDGAGRWLLAGSMEGQFQVWRFTPDGGSDPGFGENGVVTTDFTVTTFQTALHALVLDQAGRVVLAGSRQDGSTTHLMLMRLLADGKPDTGFGSEGIVDMPPPAGYHTLEAKAVAVDGEGALIVAGDGRDALQNCCALAARFHADGAMDETFGLRLMPASAITTLSSAETSTSLALLPGGRILLARNTFPFPGPENTRTRFTLIQIQANGDLVQNFGDGGWRTYVVTDPTGAGMGGPYSQLHRMVFAQGKALLFGRTFFEDVSSTGQDFVTMIRVLLDPLFTDAFESAP